MYRNHDEVVGWLYNRLKEKGLYDRIYRELPYHRQTSRGVFTGEFDVLTITGLHAVYYECKSNDNPHARRRAEEQFHRVRLAFPEYRWHYAYITPTRCRLHRESFKKDNHRNAA